ncbi:S26 family signal peptidase [Microbacterium sp. F1-18]
MSSSTLPPSTRAATRAEARTARVAAPRRGRLSRVGDVALVVAAAAGALCIVLAIAAAVFDVRVTLFSTGSMSPTIPAGAAAVARGIPASEVRVGDVVTVERAGKLPITHRVTSVAGVPEGDPEARRITMRGDANAVEDPFPYDVERVRIVMFSIPGAAPLIAAGATPPVMVGVTVAATVLVVAVFWPRRGRGRPRRRPASARRGRT